MGASTAAVLLASTDANDWVPTGRLSSADDGVAVAGAGVGGTRYWRDKRHVVDRCRHVASVMEDSGMPVVVPIVSSGPDEVKSTFVTVPLVGLPLASL